MVKAPSFGAEKLKRWQSWKTLQDYTFNLVCLGDSFTHGGYWTELFRDALISDGYPNGGPGWAGFGWAGATKALRNSSIDAVELDYDLTESDWTNTYGTGGYGAAVEHLQATAANKVINISCGVALSTLEIHFLKSGGGFTYQINSGGYTSAADESGTQLYLSDFSSTVNGFTLTSNVTTAANIDGIGGRDNCLRLTSTAATGRPQITHPYGLTVGQQYTITAEVYLPSANTAVDQVAFLDESANSVAGSVVTATNTWTRVSFSYTGAGFGYMRFSGLDGGSNFFSVPNGDIFYLRNVQVLQPNADPIGKNVIDVSGAGSSFDVDIKSASSSTVFTGCVGRTSTANALCIHKLGSSGGNAGMFASSTYWADSIKLLSPHAAIIMFGTNEQVGGTNPATYAANIQTMIDELRVITPSIDILLACPGATKYGNTASTTYGLTDYQRQLGNLAIENDCAYVDFLETIGPWSSQLVTDTFVHGDEVHPGTRGKHVYANVLHKMLK